MTTADHRPSGVRGAARRWTRGAVIALMATLAVLVHHETPAVIAHVLPPGKTETISIAGMYHEAPHPMPVQMSGHAVAPGVTAPTASDESGTCSGTVMQHCSAASVDTMKLAPPHQLSTGCVPCLGSETAIGRDVPGTTGRAPPDLSVLSRLLL
ncbi:hypothetical protein [Streptomyces mirabilis]|uniref:Uncharacterized protein n=1 Tax=Streptomyces mirabilis TaxID=68239 RepID=A0A1I2UD48_9ACTN|nr:hypothetical protein [Streptomyces mirabilis]SFG75062.1 hypothetical protein SAMN02787118_127112 [Streptomyces mirabilis]